MTKRRIAIFGTLTAMMLVPVIASRGMSQEPADHTALRPFQFRIEGAESPEQAATMLYRACAMESPEHFVKHLLIGVCAGPISTLQDFAECLHYTKFHHGDESFTVYDLPKRINWKKPIHATASQEFDPEDKQVAALQAERVSTYYWDGKLMCVDVVGEGWDGLEYRTRTVVAEVDGLWYAIPRGRSSKNFYAIADAMPAPSPNVEAAE